MTRNLCCSALILRTRASGESNRDIWLLGADAGLLRATVFGGPKSRLRSYASPFHSGQAWIYHDPVKDSRKLTDFDVRSWRPGIREMYERAMACDAVAETVLSSHGGGGNWGGALLLAEAALDALALADGEACPHILLWFLWQWADFLGLRPDFSHCSQCGRPAPDNRVLRFSLREAGIVCSACLGERAGHGMHGIEEIGPGCRRWLETVRHLPPTQLDMHPPDARSFREAKSLTTAILAGMMGRRLASWDW
ncbi:MAG: DNA repair protein RecO C-terminal domain-containing protein [Treponema sp.]|nr:DNA repair protein RecO C-terminal domain-containing protein [Treponema sp.]